MVFVQMFVSYESVQYKWSDFAFLFNGSLYDKMGSNPGWVLAFLTTFFLTLWYKSISQFLNSPS